MGNNFVRTMSFVFFKKYFGKGHKYDFPWIDYKTISSLPSIDLFTLFNTVKMKEYIMNCISS